MKVVNLASRPFENRRPVVRLAVVLSLLAIGLLIYDIVLYRAHWSASSATRDRLVSLRQEIDNERAELDRLEAEIRNVSIPAQNERVATLNRFIVQRTFPWSLLFEELEEVLPRDVKLESVSPAAEDFRGNGGRATSRNSRARQRARAQASDSLYKGVQLGVNGIAQTEEAVVELVNNMFDHPAFERPLLINEQLDGRQVRFRLEVEFLTGSAERSPVPGDEDAVQDDLAAVAPGDDGETLAASIDDASAPSGETAVSVESTMATPEDASDATIATRAVPEDEEDGVRSTTRPSPRVDQATRRPAPPRSAATTRRGGTREDEEAAPGERRRSGNRTNPPSFVVSGSGQTASEQNAPVERAAPVQDDSTPTSVRRQTRRPTTESPTAETAPETGAEAPPRERRTPRPVVPESSASGSPRIGGAP
ncbi:MAG: PilN domain-containing protein [Acidobacteriota bacterium]